jgi:hypothetical protein
MVAALIVFAAALALLMARTSGDVPRADEWGTPGEYLRAQAEGRATFADVFKQHNESRVIFARLLAGVIASHWGWNQHIFHGLNWLITVGTAALFVFLVVSALPRGRRPGWPVLLLLCSTVALVFSPVQWRNLLSSGQIITIVIPFLLLAGVAVNRKVSWPIPVRYGLAAVFALVASFSFVNGLLLWFLLWPAPFVMAEARTLRLRRSELWASVLYFVMTFAVIAAFFKGYVSVPGHPPMSYGLRMPHRTLFFALTWLAGPLMPEPMYYWQGLKTNTRAFLLCGGFAGLVGMLLGVWVLANRKRWWAAWAEKPTLLGRVLPFLPLLAYGLVSGGAIALARVGFGAAWGMTSRYSTVAVPAYLGIAGLLAVVTTELAGLRARKVLAPLAVAFAVSVLASSVVGCMQSELDFSVAKQAAVSLDFRDVVPNDPFLTNVFQSSDLAEESKKADTMEQLGLLRPRTSLAWVTEQAPVGRDDVAFSIRLVDESWSYWMVTGQVSPNTGLEEGDVLVLRDRTSAKPMAVIMAPAGSNYPGKPASVFELRYMKALAPRLDVDKLEALLVRRRTHEVWRLATR